MTGRPPDVDTGEVVDLRAVRRGRMLDELAALHRDGVDVPRLLLLEDDVMADATYTLRLPQELFDRADALVDRLSDTSEAVATGGRWGRAAVLRVAVARGLAELDKDAKKRGR